MGLSTALYTGVSGLSASGTELSVIGNDLSNTNTAAYKSGIASFANILSSSLSGSSQVGRGVELQSVTTDFSQGTLQSTDNPLDLAITGDGFFIVKTGSGVQYYTRDGQFTLNSSGDIVDPERDLLQGYLTLQGGGQLGSINVASLNSAPKLSSNVTVTAQLNSAQGLVNGLFTAYPTSTSGTVFNINSSNNTIVVNGSNVTLTSGTYTGASLAAALQAQLDQISQTATVTYNTAAQGSNSIYKFSISDNDNQFVFAATDNKINFTYDGVSYTATIPPGTYKNDPGQPDDLATAIATAMNANTAAGTDAADASGTDITVAYSGANSNELTFASGSGALSTINWNSSSTTVIPEELGFTPSDTNLTGGPLGTSPLAIDWSNASSTAANMFGFANTNGIEITSGNNVISLTDAALATPTVQVTIPAGTYKDGAALAAALNTALNNADPAINVTYDATANKISLVSTSADAVSIDWNGADIANGAVAAGGSAVALQFGFDTAAGNPANPANLAPYESDFAAGGGIITASFTPSSTGISTSGSSMSDYAVSGLDPNNAGNTSDFSTSITVYDSLGNSHLVNVYFKKVAQATDLLNPSGSNTTGNRWLYWVVNPSTDSVNGQSSINAQGMLEFNTSGALVYDDSGNSPYSSFNFGGGVIQNQSIAFNFGTAIAQSGSGLTGTTQFGSTNSISFQNQDGYSSGTLQSLSVSQNGVMSGTFTNGQTVNVASVALARFISETNLSQEGSNLYGQSSTSGSAIIGTAGTSGRGTISNSSLEGSNVDEANEFVQMIAAQQAYQGNTKVISAVNALLTALEQSITG